ncbi:MAG: zinc ABC transporter substrate-binding protein [Methanosarcinaceae archaeon]|nr:zinc ABC transporter substrate-binding protein [Methanosarcinaceae archaeon]
MNTRTVAIITLLIAVSLCNGCVEQTSEKQLGPENFVVIVSILPQVDFVEHVGGDTVKVIEMIPPGANPATYEPTASQLKMVSSARMYAKVGSGLPFEDVWLDKIRSVNPEMLIVDTSKGVDLIPGDPHIWLSPRCAMVQVENIYRGLVKVDPENERHYYQNKEQYLQDLEELDAGINESLSVFSDRTFMVFHPSWGYYARNYNLKMIAFESEGKEPSLSDMESIIEIAKEKNIHFIFVQPQFSTKSAEVIAKDIGCTVIFLDPLAKDYITNMLEVTENITQSLA